LYIERDLNAIEWRLQNNKDDVLLLEFFLKQLLILRRRTGKYESLVEDHLNLRYPSSWLTPSSAGVQRDLVLDLQQVRDMLRRNNERISQTVPLITSLMSVIEGKHATSISQQLTFLTVLATILLPFSIFASVFGMQTEYGPGESKFWVFLCGASLTPLVLACYVGFRIFLKVREKRAMAAMM
jgi:Mg2+ and Co2+ transporter CorA